MVVDGDRCEGVVDNGEDSEGNGNGGPWDVGSGFEGSTLARERSLAPSNSSGT